MNQVTMRYDELLVHAEECGRPETIMCPLGCGEEIDVKNSLKHYYVCPNAEITCTLCESTITVEERSAHAIMCHKAKE